MFAEEQAGNPAKKRADEAKARRLRAKREQEAKEQRKRNELERREREGDAATVTAECRKKQEVDAKMISQGDDVDCARTTTPSAAVASLEVHTATQRAAEQRKVRAEVRARVSAATLIQSIFRSKFVALMAREEQRRIFDSRVSDLNSLARILKQSTKAEYVPPPATVSIMTVQFLFFACPISIRKQRPGGELTLDSGTMIINERDLFRWTNLVKNLFTPGVSSDNLDLDPLLPWMGSAEGRRRHQKVLHLCISSISRKQSPHFKKEVMSRYTTSTLAGDNTSSSEKCYSSVDLFLRIILRLGGHQYSGEQRNAVYLKSYSLLMQRVAPSECRYNCDLISSLRSVLLFGPTGTNPPIPGDAGRLREKCATTDEKEMASLLLKLVVEFISSLEEVGTDQMLVHFLSSRFMCEVMTVPLLTWKCWPSSYERLLRNNASSEHLKEKANPVPPLVLCIHRFINMHADLISDGRIETVLLMPDVSLATCPAPAVLCLLANVIQIGKTCEEFIGMKIHYDRAAEYFNFLSVLVNVSPLGTFCSRMSAVEWVSVGSSTTPIVLSDVVCEQASAVLSDSYVRALFTCAINDDKLDTKNVISTKTNKDEEHEKNLLDIGMSSAASIAAKEAMIDRNRSIWQSSKWAKQLAALISGPREKKYAVCKSTDTRSVGQLMNTSSISRQLANGQAPINTSVTSVCSSHDASNGGTKQPPRHEYSIIFLLSLCRFYGIVISRWGGHGKEDLVKRGRKSKEDSKIVKDIAVATAEPCVTALLNVLCFSTSFLTSAWAIIQSNSRVVTDLYDVIDVNKRAAPIRTLTAHQSFRRLQQSDNVGALVLLIFVTCLSHTLIVTDDVEIHELEIEESNDVLNGIRKPLPIHQLRRCIVLIKKLLYRACCLDDIHEASTSVQSNHVGLALISASSKLQNELYTRSSRRLLCAPKLWIEKDLLEEDLRKCRTHSDYITLLSTPVCRLCPFLISFKRRLKLFERIVATNREDIQGSNEQRNLKPGITVKVMRGRVLEDGLAHLNKLGRNMRQRIVISYISEAGARETGIDVGGLFKEFWSDLSNLAFDPNYALFKNTEGFLMYPNPTSKLAHGPDHIILFEFLGRILGKALYEGITIQPQFAHLFLSFLRGDHNYLHLLTDLSTIDPQLYGNLMFLKNYDGDVSDLCLTFTVSHDDFGVQEVPLIVGGENIEVNNENKRRYIYLVAKHHVSDRIKEQSNAFTRGLWDVIDSLWLRLFNEPELQVLISGASDGKVDVADMKSNTRYTGGYSRLDRNVVRFWNVVSSLSPRHQADLLRFVTSCERPPPLGFASMNPPFTIQRVGIMRDADKLPTASTCFNTLKLPTYSSEKVLREKLLYSIGAGAGFELT